MLKYLLTTLFFLSTISVANAEESLLPSVDFIVSADNTYAIDSENFTTEFGMEAEVGNYGLLMGFYPTVDWDSQEIQEHKAEITMTLETVYDIQLEPHADIVFDKNFDYQETTLGFKVSKRF
jgi:hypothetical protein